MKLSPEVRAMLEGMGMPKETADADAVKWAEEHGIRLLSAGDGKGVSPDRLAAVYRVAAQSGCIDDVEKMIAAQRSEPEILDWILQHKFRAEPITTSTEIGLSKKEKRQYSFRKAILAFREKDWSGAEFEREVSEATAKHMRMAPQGFMVPMDVLSMPVADGSRAARDATDLIAGSTGTGKNTIATDLLMEEFIELLRNQLVLNRLGVRYLTGLRGNIAIPRLTGGNQHYWVEEQGGATKSVATFDQVAMTPKTLAGKTIYSRQFLLQSSLGVEAFVRYEIAAAIAAGIDEGALYGSGASGQPTGLFNISGINQVAIDTNGGAMTLDKLVQMETEVCDDNVVEDGSMAYLTNARVRGKLKTTQMFTGTNGLPLWRSEPGSRGVGDLNGYPAFVSGVIKKNLTKGTGTNLSGMAFGKWSDFLVALWGALDILADPFSGSDRGDTKVVAFQSTDFNVRHKESFCACTDIVTA